MARVDYDYHQREFTRLYQDNPDLKVKDYCDLAGLNPSTARRHITIKNAQASCDTLINRDKEDAKKKSPNSRHNWPALLKKYLTRAIKNPSLTINKFAQEEGIKAPTTRRQFRDMRNDRSFDRLYDLYDEKRALYLAASASKNGKKSGTTVESAKRRSAHAQKRVEEYERKNELKRAVFGDERMRKVKMIEQAAANDVEGVPPLNSSARAGRPLINMTYLNSALVSQDILEAVLEIDPLSVNSELLLARTNYLVMQQDMQGRLDTLVRMKEEGQPLLNDDKEEMNIDREMDRIRYGYAPRLRELEMSINQFVKSENKRYIDLRKQEYDELMRPHVLPAEEQNIVIKMLEMRKKNNWTALEACQQIEALGAKVPQSLLHEMKVELSNLIPEVDDDGTDDEVLDARFGLYEEKEKENAAWIEDRREEVARKIEATIERESNPDQLDPHLEDPEDDILTQEAYDSLDADSSGPFDMSDFEGVDSGQND